jgi:hypothetical protein
MKDMCYLLALANFFRVHWAHIPALELAVGILHVRVARKVIPPLQQAQSELQQQRVICVQLDTSVKSRTAVAVGALCVLEANLQIIAARLSVKYVGKGHIPLKVHQSASLVMQANTLERRLLHACRAVQGFPLGEVESVSHVLKAHTALQMAMCARQVLLAHFVRNQELKLFSAGPAHIPWSWVERHVVCVPKACTAPPVGPAAASRAQEARHLMQGLVRATLVLAEELGHDLPKRHDI